MSVNTGTLQLNGSTSSFVQLQSPATGAGNTLILPNGNGTDGFQLTTDGNGNLSWASPNPGGTGAGAVNYPIVLIQANSFDLSASPFFRVGSSITIPNPTNGTVGQAGLIYFAAQPAGWGTNFQFVGGTQIAPPANSVAPFFLVNTNQILIGQPQGAFS